MATSEKVIEKAHEITKKAIEDTRWGDSFSPHVVRALDAAGYLTDPDDPVRALEKEAAEACVEYCKAHPCEGGFSRWELACLNIGRRLAEARKPKARYSVCRDRQMFGVMDSHEGNPCAYRLTEDQAKAVRDTLEAMEPR